MSFAERLRPSAGTLLVWQAPGLLRELLRIRRAMARRRTALPWKLEFFVTFSCGSRCKTCLIWTRYAREPELRSEELSAEAFAKIAASIGHHLRWLSFTGGELSDRLDAAEILVRVAEAAPRARVISASSHGLAPERVEEIFEEVARRFPDRAVMVTLSLDGLGDTYTEIRGVDGSARVKESLDRLRGLARRYPNLSPSFQTTLSRRNLDQIGPILDFLRRNASGNVVTVANDSRVLTEGRIKQVDARGDARLAEALGRAAGVAPISSLSGIFSRTYLTLLRASLSEGGEAPIDCSAGFSSLSISPYGDVLQCDRHDEPLGKVTPPDHDLRKVIESPDFEDRLRPWMGCRECFTPCQAYPSMMQAPLRSAALALRRRAPYNPPRHVQPGADEEQVANPTAEQAH